MILESFLSTWDIFSLTGCLIETLLNFLSIENHPSKRIQNNKKLETIHLESSTNKFINPLTPGGKKKVKHT